MVAVAVVAYAHLLVIGVVGRRHCRGRTLRDGLRCEVAEAVVSVGFSPHGAGRGGRQAIQGVICIRDVLARNIVSRTHDPPVVLGGREVVQHVHVGLPAILVFRGHPRWLQQVIVADGLVDPHVVAVKEVRQGC